MLAVSSGTASLVSSQSYRAPQGFDYSTLKGDGASALAPFPHLRPPRSIVKMGCCPEAIKFYVPLPLGYSWACLRGKTRNHRCHGGRGLLPLRPLLLSPSAPACPSFVPTNRGVVGCLGASPPPCTPQESHGLLWCGLRCGGASGHNTQSVGDGPPPGHPRSGGTATPL